MAAEAACTPFCWNCGADMRKDEPMAAGELVLDPRGDVTVHGRVLRLTLSERVLLFTIVKAGGRVVPLDVLLDRMGSDGTTEVARVLVRRVREKLGYLIPDQILIETVWGRGYRWVGG